MLSLLKTDLESSSWDVPQVHAICFRRKDISILLSVSYWFFKNTFFRFISQWILAPIQHQQESASSGVVKETLCRGTERR